ncbi:MAG TPA: type II secretion system F family protein [Thiolapillus brandeum]|uniref:Type II secretion system F family protein n=1 Tax=Thiolapillus brandeum TaxID=1076588 RepID=A0A7C5N5Y5_9GAMM|nr:type II secretion system F family protein [Thiolapillus brandeum]
MATKAAALKKKPEKTYEFAWVGTDRRGKKIKGVMRAANDALVKADLRRQGVTPIKVQRQFTLSFGKQKITPGDIAVFSRQLATMMKAGVPLVQALDIVGKGHTNPAMQEMILTIKADIEGGTSLTNALRKHPLYFDDLFCNLVEAGEHAGVLETLLDRIATYKEKTESIKKKIKKALFYPTAVIVVGIIVTAILLIFVVPTFEELFQSFGAELPAFTQLVIDLSKFIRDYWWAILLGLAATVIILSNLWKRSPKFREMVDRAMLKAPIFGSILNKSALARFARTTSTMFAAGVPMVEALDSVAGATGSIVYGNAVKEMRDDIATGQSLRLAMEQQRLFPHMVKQMVAIGEESGALDEMLGKVADFYEEEVDNAVDSLSSLLEPLIMAILGILVGGLVVAMYLPIFKLGAVV